MIYIDRIYLQITEHTVKCDTFLGFHEVINSQTNSQSLSCFSQHKDLISKFLVTNDGYFAGRFRLMDFLFDYRDVSSSNYERFMR